ncbi:MAG: type I glutamate--ammonia ligase [Ottowia sp.]
MTPEQVLETIQQEHIEFVDLRFTDMRGVQHHMDFPADATGPDLFDRGKMFDGSSIAGWKGIQESDMVLLPDPATAFMDPFAEHRQLNLVCDVLEPATLQAYKRDPRSIARRAEAHLRASGVGDAALFGPEPEFFVFDEALWRNDMGRASYEIRSGEAAWSSSHEYDAGNRGHRPAVKGGYFPLPPVDSLADLRARMGMALRQIGLHVEVHHHEVANAGQCEIGVRFDTLLAKADQLQNFKYVVRNVAHAAGKTATFMPKPLVGDNGSGMHVHQSLARDGTNLFTGNLYGGLSRLALHYIGGIFRHAHAINAFSNSTTNSYKRLVPGFEAPVMLAYSARNRSASCRIPHVIDPRARRIEVRFPDAMNSGYLTFTALLMAGLDGILDKADPGEPMEKDLYDLPPEEERDIPQVCASLDRALEALDRDRAFLVAGDVMSDDFIDAYIALKMKEVTAFRAATHPLEYQMYYSI